MTVVLAIGAIEGWRAYRFYENVTLSKATLLDLKVDLNITSLDQSEEYVRQRQIELSDASLRLRSARDFVDTDPFLFIASRLPVVGSQVDGLSILVRAADESAQAGMTAIDVASAFKTYERQPNETSIVGALHFIRDQQAPMREINDNLIRLKRLQEGLPDDLWGSLGTAKAELNEAVTKLGSLVDAYNRASGLLPEFLGYQSPKSYLLLPQNDTELFPSGGLMSSYGVVDFEGGNLTSIDIEYFVDLFNRWQETTKSEYVEPPAPLKNYLLHEYSWGLGEAGWYPDFPTSAGLAQMFVSKGGVRNTDGTIAIDLQFLTGLLSVLGPVSLPEYGTTVTTANVDDVTLQNTRDENLSSTNHEGFLSVLSQALLTKLFATPKEQWVDLLKFLDRMGRERHLQLWFADPDLQALSKAYGFDGGIVSPTRGDFLLIADTSVNSTKLNLIMNQAIEVNTSLKPDGTARSLVTYRLQNPFPEWKVGKDPRLVSDLMIGGVYGSYTRLYAPAGAKLIDLRSNGLLTGPEQNGTELGKASFGRFLRVLPGATADIQFLYETPRTVWSDDDGLQHYSLYVQKEAGTKAIPITLTISPPPGTTLVAAMVDGVVQANAQTIVTDLRTDREIELVYKPLSK